MPMQIYSQKNNSWRDQYNPLRGMSLQKLLALLDAGERGQYADLQWFYHFMERSDAMVFSVLQRRRAALLSCDWDIRQVAEVAPGNLPPTGAKHDTVLADEQVAMLREAYDRIENLRDAVSFLFSGFFRGYAHLEKHYADSGLVTRLEPVEQWFWVRDGMYGDWEYNQNAVSGRYRGVPIDPLNFVILDTIPLNRLLSMLYLGRALAMKDWDSFLEVYGIPSVFLIGPPNTPDSKAEEYQKIAEQLISDGRGYSNRTETLTNFPALVVFSNGMTSSGLAFNFADQSFAKTNGYDLRFWSGDEVTELPYEVERWTNASSLSAFVWVRVPTIATSTDFIWAKWGDAAKGQQSYTTNGATWSSSFRGVWHLGETSGTTYHDSTANANNGTNGGSVVAAGGVIDGGQAETNTWIDCGTNSSLVCVDSNRSVSFWVKLGSMPGFNHQPMVGKASPLLVFWPIDYFVGYYNWLGGDVRLEQFPGNGDIGSVNVGLTSATWYHIAAHWDSAGITFYVNGVQTEQKNYFSGGYVDTPGYHFYIGYYRAGTATDDQTLDEVRLDTIGSTNWIWASYMTMASNQVFSKYDSLGH